MSDTIAVPDGTDIRLVVMPPFSVVAIAPPPLKAEADLYIRPGGVSGLFTFDDGLIWPDRTCRRAAESYLAAGVPIAFQFRKLEYALVCISRLKREMAL